MKWKFKKNIILDTVVISQGKFTQNAIFELLSISHVVINHFKYSLFNRTRSYLYQYNRIDLITLWHLCSKRGWDSDEIQFFRSIMDRHLFSFPGILFVSITLVHEIIQRKASPEQNTLERFDIIYTIALN